MAKPQRWVNDPPYEPERLIYSHPGAALRLPPAMTGHAFGLRPYPPILSRTPSSPDTPRIAIRLQQYFNTPLRLCYSLLAGAP